MRPSGGAADYTLHQIETYDQQYYSKFFKYYIVQSYRLYTVHFNTP